MADFLPFVRRWFDETFAEATRAQREGWEAIASGRDTLIVAPTGSGKTLAAFLWALDHLHRLGLEKRLEDRVYVVYVSPLRALNNDIEKNLRAPLAGIRAAAAAEGLKLPEIRVAVRTGDTLAAQRQAMTRRPPHVLITTPESLFILLTSERFRPALAHTRFLIVDEIHALMGSKRGAHLALSLERLRAVVEARDTASRPQRIGCSATVSPIESARGFLTGATATDAITVDAGFTRDLDLQVIAPVDDFLTAPSDTIWEAALQQIAELVQAHRTTLVFAQSRRAAERLARDLNDRLPDGPVAAHHGSLSRRARLEAENRLKAGALRALAAPRAGLAQRIAAAVAAESLTPDAVHARSGNGAPYRELSREALVAVIRSLAEPLPAEVKGAAPRILWDRVNDRLHARRGSRFLALTSGGTIPDNGLYDVFVAETDLKVGTLDEEFVTESLPGDVFLLGSHAWRIVKVRADRVLVEDAQGMSPTLPFWKGEHPSRSWELGLAVGRLRRDAAERLDAPDFVAWATDACGLDARAAGAMRAWLVKAGEILDGVPDDQGIVVESFSDEMGGRHAMIHAVFGMRINGAWGMVLKEKLRCTMGLVAEASHVDDGILLSFAPGQVPPAPERLVTLVAPEEVDALLGRALIGTPLFATRFRQCAIRALFIPRMSRGQRTPAYLQRLKADALLEAVGGQAEFPIVAETLRECFHDALDVTRFKRLLERLHDGEMWRRHVDTPLPSPFVYPLLLALDLAYLGAGHAEERRVSALDLASGRRAWVPSPDAALYRSLDTGEGLERVTLRLLRTRGPVTAAWLAERYGIALDGATGALERLTARGLVRQGAFLADAPPPQFVHIAVLDEIQRRQVHARRVPRPVASAEQFSACLLRRHHLHPDRRLVGPPGVLAALELLQGEDLPVRVWEQDLLPARVENYEREWLDRLGLAGEMVWTVFDRAPGEPGRSTRVGAALRENIGWLREGSGPPAEIDARVKNVLLHLQLRGASFAQDLTRATGLGTPDVLSALWELFWAGLVTPDTFSAIAAGMTPTRRPREAASPRRRRRGQARGVLARLPVIGRWSTLGDEERLTPEERDEARAQLLLARYGIVTRELARGDWATLRHTLLRMEYGGEVVRGYFVQGLSGEQYALAEALGDLDTPARRAEPHVLVNMIDPANLWGRIFALSRRDGAGVPLPRLPQNWLVFRQGRPRLLAEGSGRDLTPLAGWEDVDLPGVIAALQSMMERPLTLRPVRRLEIVTWDGRPVRGSPVFEPLVGAGFSADGTRLSWDGYPGPRSVR